MQDVHEGAQVPAHDVHGETYPLYFQTVHVSKNNVEEVVSDIVA